MHPIVCFNDWQTHMQWNIDIYFHMLRFNIPFTLVWLFSNAFLIPDLLLGRVHHWMNINGYCMPKYHIDGINGQMQHKVTTFLQLTNRWSTCQKIQTLPLHSGSKKRTWMQGWDMSLYSKCYLNPHFSIENIEILLDVWENCPFRCTIAFILLPFILLSIKCTC